MEVRENYTFIKNDFERILTYYRENPQVTDVNMEEISGCMVRMARMNSDKSLNEKEQIVAKECMSLLKGMLEYRKQSMEMYFNTSPHGAKTFHELKLMMLEGIYPNVDFPEDIIQEQLIRKAYCVDFFITYNNGTWDNDTEYINMKSWVATLNSSELPTNAITDMVKPMLDFAYKNYMGLYKNRNYSPKV
mgnify:CR=1 FL=1